MNNKLLFYQIISYYAYPTLKLNLSLGRSKATDSENINDENI